MPSAIIADDEPRLAEDLAARLKTLWPELSIVAVVSNGLAAVHAIAEQRPDFAFLDIRMPGLDGLQVAQIAASTRVVFVTAYDEYAVTAFESAAADYLLKPVSDARLAQCVSRLIQHRTRAADPQAGEVPSARIARPALEWLTVKLADTTRLVAVNAVLYFRSSEKYTEAVTATERHLVRTALKDLLDQLPPGHFAQIHRSIVVNLRAVERIERDVLGRSHVYLRDRTDVLPLSRSYADRFKQS